MPVIGTFDLSVGDSAFSPVVALGLSRLPVQFKDKFIIESLVAICLTPIQALENTIADVTASRNVNTATGVSLTNLGKLVGLPRITSVDDDFRRYGRAQIATNKSLTTFENILTVAVLVLGSSYTGSYVLHNEGTATARLSVLASAVTDTAASILATLAQAATAVGVKLVISYETVTPASVFEFDTGPGWDVGVLATQLG